MDQNTDIETKRLLNIFEESLTYVTGDNDPFTIGDLFFSNNPSAIDPNTSTFSFAKENYDLAIKYTRYKNKLSQETDNSELKEKDNKWDKLK